MTDALDAALSGVKLALVQMVSEQVQQMKLPLEARMSELEKVNLMLREQLEEMSTRLANVKDMSSVASPPLTPSTAVPAANTAPQSPSHGKERPLRIQMEERKQWYIGAIVHLTRLEKLQAQDTKPTTIRIPEGCSQPEGLHDALIPESTASTAMECNAPKEDLWRHYKPRGFTEVHKSTWANSRFIFARSPARTAHAAAST